MTAPTNRRTFLKTSALAGAGVSLPGVSSQLDAGVHAGADETIKVGLVGCGGRGTGAANQALSTDGPVALVAVADLFGDRAQSSLDNLRKSGVGERVQVKPDHVFTGFDGFKKLLQSDVDLVILATPPHFRPEHFEAAVAAGKNVFFEKPVAVDGHGIRRVLKANEQAKAMDLKIGCGLQRHHQNGYVETMKRVHDGAIGEIVAAHCYWNMGFLWKKARQPQWSALEWQLRNWLYFDWASGDHIVEQHVHNLDVINWGKQGHPTSCHGMGGRQVRTGEIHGNIFDHHAVNYQYEDGSWMFSQCRQIAGCRNEVAEHLIGTKGVVKMDTGSWRISGENAWQFKGEKNNPYQTEHDDLFRAIRNNLPYNEGDYVAHSTMTAIMGRMATYSGKAVTWEAAINDPVRLGPETYDFDIDLEIPPVAMPGQGG